MNPDYPKPGEIWLCDIGAAISCHAPCRILTFRETSCQPHVTVEPLQKLHPPSRRIITDLPVHSRCLSRLQAATGIQLYLF